MTKLYGGAIFLSVVGMLCAGVAAIRTDPVLMADAVVNLALANIFLIIHNRRTKG